MEKYKNEIEFETLTLFNFYGVARVQYVMAGFFRLRANYLKFKVAMKSHKTLRFKIMYEYLYELYDYIMTNQCVGLGALHSPLLQWLEAHIAHRVPFLSVIKGILDPINVREMQVGCSCCKQNV